VQSWPSRAGLRAGPQQLRSASALRRRLVIPALLACCRPASRASRARPGLYAPRPGTRGPGPDSTLRVPGPAGPGQSLCVKLATPGVAESGLSGPGIPGSALRVGSLAISVGPGHGLPHHVDSHPVARAFPPSGRRAGGAACRAGHVMFLWGTGGGRRSQLLPWILSVVDKAAVPLLGGRAEGGRGSPAFSLLVGALGATPCQSVISQIIGQNVAKQVPSNESSLPESEAAGPPVSVCHVSARAPTDLSLPIYSKFSNIMLYSKIAFTKMNETVMIKPYISTILQNIFATNEIILILENCTFVFIVKE
jgi:hypothetical protein